MPKEIPYRITQDDPNITALTTFTTNLEDTWKYRVPQHLQILIKPGDIFSVKVYDSGDAEYVWPDALIQLEVRDPSEQTKELLYGPDNYNSLNQFQQKSKRRKLTIEKPILLKPRSWIVFMTKDSTGIDTASMANSYFEFLTTKIVTEG